MQRRIFLIGLAGALASACKKPASTEPLANLVVHKSEGCACCDGWVRHLRAAGFAVEVREESNMNEIKTRVGVPAALWVQLGLAALGGALVLLAATLASADLRRALRR